MVKFQLDCKQLLLQRNRTYNTHKLELIRLRCRTTNRGPGSMLNRRLFHLVPLRSVSQITQFRSFGPDRKVNLYYHVAALSLGAEKSLASDPTWRLICACTLMSTPTNVTTQTVTKGFGGSLLWSLTSKFINVGVPKDVGRTPLTTEME